VRTIVGLMLMGAMVASGLVANAMAEGLPQPPRPTTSTDPDHCRWIWWSGVLPMGGSIGVWTERCDLVTGRWELDYTATLPGFRLTIDDEEQAAVIQVFAKPAEADISTILPELRRRGYIPDDDECVFRAALDETMMSVGPTPRTRAVFEIVPTGSRLAAHEATPDDEVPEPQCGEYGWSAEGVRYFLTDVAHSDRVIYVNIGQDGMMFDQSTIALAD
jgi:hypothetical protein